LYAEFIKIDKSQDSHGSVLFLYELKTLADKFGSLAISKHLSLTTRT